MQEVHFINTDGVEALDEIVDIIEARGQQVLLTGINQNMLDLLDQLSRGYKKLKDERSVFKKSTEALRFLGVVVSTKV